MTNRFHQSGKATIWTIVAAVCVVLLGLAVILPILSAQRRASRQRGLAGQLRGVQGAMVLFAQGNNNYYPCFNGNDLTSFTTPAGWSQGARDGREVSQRLAMLLLQNFFSGEYIISFSEESKKTIWTQGTVTTANYSCAMLQLPQPPDPATATMTQPAPLDGRLKEWSNTINTLAPVLSDRSMVIDPTMKTTSLWVTSTNSSSPTNWRGTVVWNDMHASFESSSTLPTTRYGQTDNTNDDLFTATGDADAFMRYGK
jgi:hypothetical protein